MGDQEGMRRAERAVIADPGRLTMHVGPPDGRKYWLEESMLPQDRLKNIKPTFKIGEVAKVFFARSPDWLRWLGHQQEAGTPGAVLEVNRTKAGSRIYTLVDVERIAHTLLEADRINVRQFNAAISIVRWMAYAYGILGEKDMLPPENRNGDIQQVLTGMDEEIKAALLRGNQCSACLEGRHEACETADLVEEQAQKGQAVYQIGNPCACYAQDEDKHRR